jgi:hypothetical protein
MPTWNAGADIGAPAGSPPEEVDAAIPNAALALSFLKKEFDVAARCLARA